MAANLDAILRLFQMYTGLRINRRKTKVYAVGEVPEIGRIAGILGCKVDRLPCMYLGLPLGDPYKSMKSWENVIDRFNAKLDSWKTKFLSKGGKLTLIKATLSGLPTYLMSLLPIPARIADQLEKMMSRFLWGTTNNRRKYHLVSWEGICQPKNQGGLGIRRLKDFNRALLAKWHWKYASENPSKLWKQCITEKYGVTETGWSTKVPRGTHSCSRWKAIMLQKEDFFANTKIKIGNGTRVDFWNDIWSSNSSLKASYPSLFSVSVRKYGTIRDFILVDQGESSWCINMRRRLTDNEINEMIAFLTNVEIPTFTEEADELQWRNNGKSMIYSVRKQVENYQVVQRDRTQNVEQSIPWKRIWHNQIPTKVQFFVWSLIRGRILTQDKLKALGLLLPSRCLLCKNHVENDLHLIFLCDYSTMVWQRIRGSFKTTAWDLRTLSSTLMTWTLKGSLQ